MKKLLLITGMLFCLGLCSKAQEPSQNGQNQQNNNPDGADKIESLKVAFLSQKMNLSPKQAEKFWPVYNNYQKEMQQLVNERKQFRQNNKAAGNVSDAQADQNLDQEFAFRQKALAIQEKYKNEFLKVLPPRKVASFYKSEGEFRNRLIHELRNRGNVQQNPGAHPNRQFMQAERRQPAMHPPHPPGGGGRRR